LKHLYIPTINWDGNGGFDRINYFQLYDLFDAKKKIQFFLIRQLVILQKKLRYKRSYSDQLPQKLFGGSTYWSLNREALNYVINYTDKGFLKRLKFTFCAEEIYFQTILLNSPYAKSIVNNNLRFIDWSSGKGGYPAFLDESDFIEIISSNNYFARKIKNHSNLRLLLMNNYQKL
jgi:hypothetical protein